MHPSCSHWHRWLRAVSPMLLLSLSAMSAFAATDYEKHTAGLAVYLGVLPAQLLRGASPADHLATMHGGLPSGSGSHHVVISVFDEQTGRQLDDLVVEAAVAPLGMGETRRTLERMTIGATTTYGNFFPMDGPGPFTIRVTIRLPNQRGLTSVQFNYAHPR
jgi:hypothetical protein